MVLYDDNFWYRARIVDCKANGHYMVVLVDRGNDFLVESNKKIRTPYHFGDIPALAKRVVLNNVVPTKENAQPHEWERDALDNLFNCIYYQKTKYEINIKYVEEPVDDLPIKVVMIQKSLDERTGKKKSADIGKRMVILGEAMSAEFETRDFKEQYDTWGHTSVIDSGNAGASRAPLEF